MERNLKFIPVLTKSEAKNITYFTKFVDARINMENKSVELFTQVETYNMGSYEQFVIARIRLNFGDVEAYGLDKKGKRRDYKTIKGLANFISTQYGSCLTPEALKSMLESMEESIKKVDIESEKNSLVVNVAGLSAGTIATIGKEVGIFKAKETVTYDMVDKLVDAWVKHILDSSSVASSWQESWLEFSKIYLEKTIEKMGEIKMKNNYTYTLEIRIPVKGKHARIVATLDSELHSKEATKTKLAKEATRILCERNGFNSETVKNFDHTYQVTIKSLKKKIVMDATDVAEDDEIINIEPSKKAPSRNVAIAMRMADGRLEMAEATKYNTKVEAFKKYRLYARKKPNGTWQILEASTGVMLVDSLDSKKGLEERLKLYVSRVDEVDKKIKKIHLLYGNANPSLVPEEEIYVEPKAS